jgi:hypothetical protein
MQRIKGYILIKLVPGLEAQALARIRATPGVAEVSPVFGHWDAIAVTEAQSLHSGRVSDRTPRVLPVEE